MSKDNEAAPPPTIVILVFFIVLSLLAYMRSLLPTGWHGGE